MQEFPQNNKWMAYAIRRTNQITECNILYDLDTQRITMLM